MIPDSTQQEPIILVDGSWYLYRAYHALPPLMTSKQQPTGAIRGVISMIKKILEDHPNSPLAVVFDAKGKTFRHDMYKDYKANRPPMPEDLIEQIEPIHKIIRGLGIKLLSIEGVEADDIIGTLANEADEKGLSTMISTGDKDMTQLVGDHVKVVNTMSGQLLDESGVEKKFGVKPNQIVDYLALIGDTSDNVPGVEKVGPKTAVKWLLEYNNLENLIKNSENLSGQVGENLRKGLQQLKLSKKLVTIKRDIRLPFGVDNLRVDLPDIDNLEILYKELEFKAWSKEIEYFRNEIENLDISLWVKLSSKSFPLDSPKNTVIAICSLPKEYDEKVVFTLSGKGSDDFVISSDGKIKLLKPFSFNSKSSYVLTLTASPDSSEWIGKTEIHFLVGDYKLITSIKDLDVWIDRIKDSKYVALDTETSGLKYMDDDLVGISLSIQPGEAAYIPVGHNKSDKIKQLSRDVVLKKLKPVIESRNIKIVGQNIKFDRNILSKYGISIDSIENDTMLMSYILNNTASRHNLVALAQHYLGHKAIAFEEVAGKGIKQISFDKVPISEAVHYASEDADITYRLYETLNPILKKEQSLIKLLEEIEIPLIKVLSDMEQTGTLLNPKVLNAQSKSLLTRIIKLEVEAYELAGEEFNLRSTKQLGEIFYKKLNYPNLKPTPGGKPSTSEEVLKQLAKNFDLPKIILEHRTLSKLKSTYTDSLPLQISNSTGRIHTSFGQAITSTGRLSSSDPNLQNIPIRTEDGRRIRQAFEAPQGYKLISADYSQVELRVMAHLSEDKGLINAFANEEDIHASTASEVFGVELKEVDTDQRRKAKTINFGLIYGLTAFGLSEQLGINRNLAAEYMERYFSRYPRVMKYRENIINSAKKIGYVETLFGRRIYLPGISMGNANARRAAERAAINAPVQGTAADIMKKAMILVDSALKDSNLDAKMILQIHDELVIESIDKDCKKVSEILIDCMSKAAKLAVPLEVQVGFGNNWDQAH